MEHPLPPVTIHQVEDKGWSPEVRAKCCTASSPSSKQQGSSVPGTSTQRRESPRAGRVKPEGNVLTHKVHWEKHPKQLLSKFTTSAKLMFPLQQEIPTNHWLLSCHCSFHQLYLLLSPEKSSISSAM